jgi:hypothetical protein
MDHGQGRQLEVLLKQNREISGFVAKIPPSATNPQGIRPDPICAANAFCQLRTMMP